MIKRLTYEQLIKRNKINLIILKNIIKHRYRKAKHMVLDNISNYTNNDKFVHDIQKEDQYREYLNDINRALKVVIN